MKIKNMVAAALLSAAMITGATAAEAKGTSSATAAKVCTTIKVINGKVWRDVFYMYGSGNYHYFLDPTAEPGRNVYAVHIVSLDRWGIDINKLRPGQVKSGIFDKTGRDLLKIK